MPSSTSQKPADERQSNGCGEYSIEKYIGDDTPFWRTNQTSQTINSGITQQQANKRIPPF
jgi:hypothetical protein